MSSRQRNRKLPRRSVKKRVRYDESDVEEDQLIELVKYGEDVIEDFYEELDNRAYGEDNPEEDGFVADDEEKEEAEEMSSSSESFDEDSEPSDNEEVDEPVLEDDEKPKKMTREKLEKEKAKVERDLAEHKANVLKIVDPKYICPTKDDAGESCSRFKTPKQAECSKCQSYRKRRPDGMTDRAWELEKENRKQIREQKRQQAIEDKLAIIEAHYNKRLKK